MLSEKKLKSMLGKAWDTTDLSLVRRKRHFARLIESATLRNAAMKMDRKWPTIVGAVLELQADAARCAKAAKEASRG